MSDPAEPYVIIGPQLPDGSFRLTREPTGFVFGASSWVALWTMLPEVGVPWYNVHFLNAETYDQVHASWGPDEESPPRPEA